MSERVSNTAARGNPLLRQIAVPPQPCPYLSNRVALLPPEFPLTGEVTSSQLDHLLAHGYRRCGPFYYRTQCPGCAACIPLRIPVKGFTTSSSQRRVERRGDQHLEWRLQTPRIDQQRVELFNAHRTGQNLIGLDHNDITAKQYGEFLLSSTCQTHELVVEHAGRLIAVSILDVGQQSTSAVYTFFDPEYARYSLGTYAILKHIQIAQRSGRRYCYLGFYVAANPHLNYKARYRPHERFLSGRWQPFGSETP